MKCGILLNEIWQTKNNWKKWQRINEIWHTSGQGIKIHLNPNFPFHVGRQCKILGGTNVGFYALLLSNQGQVKNCRLTSNGSILYQANVIWKHLWHSANNILGFTNDIPVGSFRGTTISCSNMRTTFTLVDIDHIQIESCTSDSPTPQNPYIF